MIPWIGWQTVKSIFYHPLETTKLIQVIWLLAINYVLQLYSKCSTCEPYSLRIFLKLQPVETSQVHKCLDDTYKCT